jgi:hypothetical protein
MTSTITTVMESVPASNFAPQYRELSPGFGLELTGCDFSKGVPKSISLQIKDLVVKVNKLPPSLRVKIADRGFPFHSMVLLSFATQI